MVTHKSKSSEQERLLQEETSSLQRSSFDLRGGVFRSFQEEATGCFETREVSKTGGGEG